MVIAASILFSRVNLGLMIALLVISPLWIVNVTLGGRLNDSPLDGIERFKKARRALS